MTESDSCISANQQRALSRNSKTNLRVDAHIHGTVIGWRAHGRGRRRRPSPARFAYREFPQHFPRPGWVEHDPDEIWRAVQRDARRGRRRRSTSGDASPRSASPTSARRSSCGTAATGRPLPPRHRVAGPAHRRHAATSCAPPATSRSIRRAHRARARPVLLRHQARVAAARGRRRRPTPTSRSAPSTRGCCGTSPAARARDRAVERQPHDALRHRRAATGPTSSATSSACPASCLPDGAAEQRALRHHRSRRAPPGSRVPVSGHRRRPAGRAVRPGVLRRRG